MSKPLVVSIPHQLGKAEAHRRLETGFTRLKTQFGDKIASLDERWDQDRMSFRAGAMGQTIDGHLDVMDDQVRVEVRLPWLLAVIAEKARHFIQKQGTLMLDKK
jgi:hypothetical protein